jgi:putative sterol carrier protein
MSVFPSPEWLDAYVDAINASSELREEAKDWEGDITLVVEGESSKGVTFDSWAWFDLRHGETIDAKIVSQDEGEKARFVIRGSYSIWKEVLKGKLEPIKAMTQGKFKLAGDLHEIRERVRAVGLLVSLARHIPTKFPDEER